MYSYVKFYKKDSELHEIHFPLRFGGLKGVNTPGEKSNNSDFNEMGKMLNHIFRVLTDLINHYVSEF